MHPGARNGSGIFLKHFTLTNMTHESKDGRVLLLANMDENHLKNTVRSHLRKIREAKETLANTGGLKVFGAFYGQKVGDIEGKMLRQINQSARMLPDYIMECMIRGIEFREELANAFDRPLNAMEPRNPFFDLFQMEIDKTPKVLNGPEEAAVEPEVKFSSGPLRRASASTLESFFQEKAVKHNVMDGNWEDECNTFGGLSDLDLPM